jgi:hypothetical protein
VHADEVFEMYLEGTKIYLQPMNTLLNAINDLIELQNGTLTFSDTSCGKISFEVGLYSANWEFQFSVEDIGLNRSKVKIGLDGDKRDDEDMIRLEYALLDSMLVAGARIQVAAKG